MNTIIQKNKTFIFFFSLLISIGYFFALPSRSQVSPILQLEMTEEESIFSVDIAPDGKYIAAGGDHYIIVWEAIPGKIIWKFGPALLITHSLNFSPIGDTLITAILGPQAFLFDVKTGDIIKKYKSNVTRDPKLGLIDMGFVAFTSDGKQIITKSSGEYKIWDVDSGNEYLDFTYIISNARIIPLKSPNEILVDNSSNEIEIWDIEKVTKIKSFTGTVPIVSGNKNILAYILGDKIMITNLDTGTNLYEYTLKQIPLMYLRAISYDGEYLIFGGYINTGDTAAIPVNRSIYKLKSYDPIRSYPININSDKNNSDSEDKIIKFFPDGKKILTVNGNRIHIFDISDLTTEIKDAPEHK